MIVAVEVVAVAVGVEVEVRVTDAVAVVLIVAVECVADEVESCAAVPVAADVAVQVVQCHQ